ncbi:hypothetical protein BCR44DRAFT_1044775 [Catenaria anguillulae PL171]|uniref:F-box domain-containing protein n=1 Tax=Catenaria anguillulae PL171 TaxID=765915 RepID=A0A1Y2HW57_9FUNG|nr:hypothetical protein BCR44DRAFT_1044775 [Catenaria anguillulae PL171]
MNSLQSDQPCPLATLPFDIIQHLVQCLDLASVARLRSTSKFFQAPDLYTGRLDWLLLHSFTQCDSALFGEAWARAPPSLTTTALPDHEDFDADTMTRRRRLLHAIL